MCRSIRANKTREEMAQNSEKDGMLHEASASSAEVSESSEAGSQSVSQPVARDGEREGEWMMEKRRGGGILRNDTVRRRL